MGPRPPQLAQLRNPAVSWARTHRLVHPVLSLGPAWDPESELPALSSPPCGCNHPPGPRSPSCSHSRRMSFPLPNQGPGPLLSKSSTFDPFSSCQLAALRGSWDPGALPSPRPPLTEVEMEGEPWEAGAPTLGRESPQPAPGMGS